VGEKHVGRGLSSFKGDACEHMESGCHFQSILAGKQSHWNKSSFIKGANALQYELHMRDA